MKPGEATEPTFVVSALPINNSLFIFRIEVGPDGEEIGVQLLGPDGWWSEWHPGFWRPNGTNKTTVVNPVPHPAFTYVGTKPFGTAPTYGPYVGGTGTTWGTTATAPGSTFTINPAWIS